MTMWLEPWKPFLPVLNMSSFIPLVDQLPAIWQTVFAIILLTLLAAYYLFLVIRENPWRHRRGKQSSKEPDPEPPIAPMARQSLTKPRKRRY